MPAFRDRPLTYLYLAATGLLATVSATLVIFKDFGLGIVVGQMTIVGAWFVLGSAHRLVRGTVFVAAIALFASYVALLNRELFTPRWFEILGPVFITQTTVAVSAWLTNAVRRRLENRRNETGAGVLRYPLIEIFGWTILVAVASGLLKYARLLEPLRSPEASAFILQALVAGYCYGVWKGPGAVGRRTVLTAAAVFAYYVAFWPVLVQRNNVLLKLATTALLCLGGFIYCHRLDKLPRVERETASDRESSMDATAS